MPGDDLVVGGFTVRGVAGFSTSVNVGSTSAVVGTNAAQAITGLYRVTISTVSGSGWLGAALGSTSFGVARIPSTSFTFSTNDLVLGVTLPTSGTSTGAELGASGLLVNGLWPTSSGGLAFRFTNPSTSVSLSAIQPSDASAGVITVVVLRTT